jgi:hypothetical protein
MAVVKINGRYNLFRSLQGITLPLEVCLKILEGVVDIEPKNVRVLMRLSKVSLAYFCCQWSLRVMPYISFPGLLPIQLKTSFEKLAIFILGVI